MDRVIVPLESWVMLIESAEHLGACAVVNCGYCAACREVVKQCKESAEKQQGVRP